MKDCRWLRSAPINGKTDHSCDWPVSNPNFLPTLQRMTDFLFEQKLIK
jgi:hypothetical protein